MARRGWKESIEQDNKLGVIDIFLFEVSAITKCMFVPGNTYLIQTAGKVTSKEVVKEGLTARGQLRSSMSHIVSWRKWNVAGGDGRTQNCAGHAQCVRVVGAEYGCGKTKGKRLGGPELTTSAGSLYAK